MNYININNNQCIPVSNIPETEYATFYATITDLLEKKPERHCITYFGHRLNNKVRLFCCIADDIQHDILVSSTIVDTDASLNSFAAKNLAFEKFEREIHENFGVKYIDHPWLKPVRYPYDKFDPSATIANYPFFSIDSEELHEVGVGPIHAGIIEPGHFRFICNGEQILHLEIQLGYQHRGVEKLFLDKKKVLQRVTLAESIAGDTVVGHTTAFVNLWESLCGYQPDRDLQYSRTLALEIERIAIHTGDLSAMCTDIAYQLGSSVFGRLRTPVINYFQHWCGNRLAKSLIRPGKINFPYTPELAETLLKILESFEPDFNEMCKETFSLPTAIGRFEKTGIVTKEDAMSIGAVGMVARTSGINRDIRSSHPHDLYSELDHQPVIKRHGDVYSRAQIRKSEVRQSIGYIRKLLQDIPLKNETRQELNGPGSNLFAISLTEGWRGEICHCAITDDRGDLLHYKIKDPSFHNWLALALAVRNNEISDFPICNKSFDLSYCGHDL
jgi:Ni,Fe-hydrogenase III large subunit